MIRRFLPLAALLVGLAASAQTPEELYQEFITPETRAIMERFEEAERHAEQARAAERGRKALVLSGAILVGLIPLGYIGRNIIRNKSWRDNPSGTVLAIGAGLAGGAVLFGLNYGVFLLKMRLGNAFNTGLAFLIVAALIVGSVYLLRRHPH